MAKNLTPGEGFRYPLFHLAVLAIPCLPFLVPAALRARSFAIEDLRAAALNAGTMTACSLVAKLVAVAMGLIALAALGRIAERLFSRRAARWAIFLAATNVSVAYYGRTSNLDGPALMWTALALASLVEEGPRARIWFAVFAAAAVATKDHACASFLFLIPLVWRRPRALLGMTEILGASADATARAPDVISVLMVDRPDVILLDVRMAWIDGIELCRAIKRNDRYAEIPVVFVSARVSREDVNRGLAAGAADYIKKPFQLDDLLARVQRITELRA